MTRHHAERSINMFDKKSSFGLWRQAAKTFFNDTIALFVS